MSWRDRVSKGWLEEFGGFEYMKDLLVFVMPGFSPLFVCFVLSIHTRSVYVVTRMLLLFSYTIIYTLFSFSLSRMYTSRSLMLQYTVHQYSVRDPVVMN